MKLSSQLSPNINILVVVPRGVVELHQELDEAECLDVHVVGVDLVPHGLGPAATDTEHHDGLKRARITSHIDQDSQSPPVGWIYFISIQLHSTSSGHINLRKTQTTPSSDSVSQITLY